MATQTLSNVIVKKLVLAGKKGDKPEDVEALNIEFKPEAGQVEIWGYRFGDDDPPPISFMLDDGEGPPQTFEEMVEEAIKGDKFGDNFPPSVIPGGVLIEVFEPGATSPKHTLETKDYTNDLTTDDIRNKSNLLTFNVPAILAKRKWLCRLTNLSPVRSLCTGTITAPWVSVEIEETRIPRRLLNRVFAELLKAFGLQIYANKWIGLIAIDEDTADIAHLADGIVSRVDIDEIKPPFTDVKGLELNDLKIEAGIDNKFPEIKISSEFVVNVNIAKWNVFGVDIIKGLEIRKVNILIDVMLRESEEIIGLIGRTIVPSFDVNVEIKGDQGKIVRIPAKVDRNCDFELTINPLNPLALEQFRLNDVEKLIECVFKKFFTDEAARGTMVTYLTKGLRDLVQRNHFIWDIRADAQSYIVRHFGLPISTVVPDPEEELEGGHAVIAGGVAIGENTNIGIGVGSLLLDNLEDIKDDAGLAGETDDDDGDKDVEVPSPEDKPNKALKNLDKIEHIVVLMLENRSFDHLLGYLSLHGGRDDIDGLTGNESNIKPGGATDGQGNPVLIRPTPISKSFFKYSPHHDFENVKEQINGGKMDGFAQNFLDRFKTESPEWVMSYYREDVLTTYDKLASTYAVCDRWFCAHPGPTWPNRICTLTGRIPELDNFSGSDRRVGYFEWKTVFDVLNDNGVEWLYYEQDLSMLRLFNKYRLDDEHILPFASEHDPKDQYASEDYFIARAKSGTLPAVTFIDPNFADIPPFAKEDDEISPLETVNDDHPPADLANGQELVRIIYNALVQSPQWEKTLFVITYDEHGGFYDHVPPPGTDAAPPLSKKIPKIHKDGPHSLGVRVPTIVVSPWVKRKAKVNHRLFDHTSIIKTIFLKFNNGKIPKGFGKRLSRVNHLGVLLQRDTPRLNPPIIEKPSESESELIGENKGLIVNETVAKDFHDVMQRFALPNFK